MRHHARSLSVAALSLLLTSYAEAPHFAPALLAALDPVQAARTLCAVRPAQNSLAARLLLAATAATPAGAAAPMPLFDDLARPGLAVSTRDADARRYFAQGLMFTYGFNHAGAVRSFRAAQRLDPGCARCWWGEALALGPNINAAMDARDHHAAIAAIDRAMALRTAAAPLEQALIEALALRYARDPAADRAALDAAYADAMLEVARRFPASDDVAVLAAEAVMDTTPWNYWEADRETPIGRVGEAVWLVETVLARNPTHPQAGHLYIHLLEAADPARAETVADRLAAAAPQSAGHLVHMPSHIYHRRGRYRDSIVHNIAAVRADEAYVAAAGDHGLVRYGYYPHNLHFIVAAAQMAGDVPTAVREAQRLRGTLDVETSSRIAWIQAIDAAPYQAMAQVGEADAILAMPPPDLQLAYARAMHHYARAVAHAQRKDRAAFDREIAAIDAVAASPAIAEMVAQAMPAADLLTLAKAVARGRFEAASGAYGAAAGHYRQALMIEAKLPYQEPPWWYYPVSQSLGAALLLDGRHDAAAQAFRDALAQWPNNGWALYGLAQSERARGNAAEAAAATAAFTRAWAGDSRWLDLSRL